MIDPATGITTISQANIGKEINYGLGLNASIQVFKWWKLNGHVNVYNKILESDQNLALESDNQKAGYSFGTFAVFQLPKEFNLMAMCNYRSAEISYQLENYRDLLFLAGAEKTLFEKLKIQAFYNPFST